MTRQQKILDIGFMALAFSAFGYGLTNEILWGLFFGAVMVASTILGQRRDQRKKDEFGFWRVEDKDRKAVRMYEHSGELGHLNIDSAVIAYDRARGLADEPMPPKFHAVATVIVVPLVLSLAFEDLYGESPTQQAAFVFMAGLFAFFGIVNYKRQVAYQSKWETAAAEIDNYGRFLAFGKESTDRSPATR